MNSSTKMMKLFRQAVAPRSSMASVQNRAAKIVGLSPATWRYRLYTGKALAHDEWASLKAVVEAVKKTSGNAEAIDTFLAQGEAAFRVGQAGSRRRRPAGARKTKKHASRASKPFEICVNGLKIRLSAIEGGSIVINGSGVSINPTR